MSMRVDIKTIGKLLMSLIAVVFLLSACTDTPDAANNNVYNTGENDSKTPQQRAEDAAKLNPPL